nr:DUF2341 domain-containing protein [Ferrimicrobium acidiphilum]
MHSERKKWVSMFFVWIVAFSSLFVLVPPLSSAATYSGTSGLAASTVTNTVYYNTSASGSDGAQGNAYWWGENFTGTATIGSVVNASANITAVNFSASGNPYSDLPAGSGGVIDRFYFQTPVMGAGPQFDQRFSNRSFGTATADYEFENAFVTTNGGEYYAPSEVYVNITNKTGFVYGTWSASNTSWGNGAGYQYLIVNPTWYLSPDGVDNQRGGYAPDGLFYNFTVIYSAGVAAALSDSPAGLVSFMNSASNVNNATNTLHGSSAVVFGYGFTNPAGTIPLSLPALNGQEAVIQENIFLYVDNTGMYVYYEPWVTMSTQETSTFFNASTTPGDTPTRELQYISAYSYSSSPAADTSISYQIASQDFQLPTTVTWNSTVIVYNPVAPVSNSLTQTITESGNWWNSTFTLSSSYTAAAGTFIVQNQQHTPPHVLPGSTLYLESSATFDLMHVAEVNAKSPWYFVYMQQSTSYGSISYNGGPPNSGLIANGTNPAITNPASVGLQYYPESISYTSDLVSIYSPGAFVMLHSETLSISVSVETFSNFYPVFQNDHVERASLVPNEPDTIYANVSEIVPNEKHWARISLGDGQVVDSPLQTSQAFTINVSFLYTGTWTPVMTVFNVPSGSSLFSNNTSLNTSFDLPAIHVTGYGITVKPKAGSQIPAMEMTNFTLNATTAEGDSFTVEKLFVNGALTDEWNKAGQAVSMVYPWYSLTPEILNLQWYLQSTYYHETVYANYTANLIPASNTSAVGVEFSSNITRYQNVSRLPAMENNTSSEFAFPTVILNNNYTTQKDVYNIQVPPHANYAEVFLNASWQLYYAYPSEETYYHYNWTSAVLFSNLSGFAEIQVVAVEVTNLIGSPSLVSLNYQEHGQSLQSTDFTAAVQWRNYSQIKVNTEQLSSPYVQLPYGASATVTVYDLWGDEVGSLHFMVFSTVMAVTVPLNVSQVTFTFINASQTNSLYLSADAVNRTVIGDYAILANGTTAKWTTTIYSFALGITRTYAGEVATDTFMQQVYIYGAAPPGYVTFEVDAYAASNAGTLGNTGPSATAQTLEALLFVDGSRFPIGATFTGLMGQTYSVRVADLLNQTLYESNITLSAPESTDILTIQHPSWIFQITNNEQIANLSSPLATEVITVSNNTTSKPVYTAATVLPPSFSFTASVGQTVAVYLRQGNYSIYLHDNATFLTTIGLFGNAYFHVFGQALLTQQQYDRSLREILNNSAHLQVVARSAPSTAVPGQPLDYSWGINMPNGTPLQKDQLQWLLANSSFAVVGNTYPVTKNVTGPTIPYVPVTLTNNQNTATPADFQQLIKVDWSLYAAYLNANLSNVRFYGSSSLSSSSELYAWLENNDTAAAASSNVWVNLLQFSVPASGSATIYMAFLATTVTWSSHWGLAPELTTKYGQFDNGAKVFEFYDNFSGTALASDWTVSTVDGAPAPAVDNGISFGAGGGGTGLPGQIMYNNAHMFNLPGNFVFDASITQVTTSTVNQAGIAIWGQLPTAISTEIDNTVASTIEPALNYRLFNVNSAGTIDSVNLATTADSGLMSVLFPSTSVTDMQINYGPLTANTADVPSASTSYYFGFTIQSSTTMSVQWIDVRLYPPDGVMPSVTFGSVGGAPSSTTTVTISSVVQSNSFVSGPPPLLNTNFSAPQPGTYTVSFESYLLSGAQMYGVTWSSGLTVSQLYNTSEGILITIVGPPEVQSNTSTAYVIEVDFSGGAPLTSQNATEAILGNLSVSIYYAGNFIGFASPYFISPGKIGFAVNESTLGSTYAVSAVVKPTIVLGRNASATAFLSFAVLPYNPANPPTTQDGIIAFLTSEPMLVFYFVATMIGILAYAWPHIPWVARREEKKQSMDAVGNTVEGIIALKVGDNQPLTPTETAMWNAIPEHLRNELITRLTSGKIRRYPRRNVYDKKKRLF